MPIELRIDPFPSNADLSDFWLRAWGETAERDFSRILSRSLTHVGACAEGLFVGFVNVAWDGGIHAFILNTAVDLQWRRQGIASNLVSLATDLARERGALWLHVDYEPHLEGLYRACGFHPTRAGLIDLAAAK
jgi:ribosomal protein S18 acetylase RimI-like enzyme